MHKIRADLNLIILDNVMGFSFSKQIIISSECINDVSRRSHEDGTNKLH